jgi:DNA modification methylase
MLMTELFENYRNNTAKTNINQKPIECLGMTFESDEERRQYFQNILAEKLKDPKFRSIEGFPLGKDEDILALSDPPYYTACPNPWIDDFISFWNNENQNLNINDNELYHREPFAADVSEGKNDPIYNAHSYHTKVPHKAIMRYILHYTEPGDIVLDGFCGTGMTGVAAQLCGDKPTVESLGYRVDMEGTIYQKESNENGKENWIPFSKLGPRRAILNDLSPAATFIAYNYNTPVDVKEFEREAKRILAEVEKECGWMYETLHFDGKTKGRINYTVWSDVFVCPYCTREVVFWKEAVDKETGEVYKEFPCPHCQAILNKRNMERAWVNRYDSYIERENGQRGVVVKQAKQIPVLINYRIGNQRFEKAPDQYDFELIEKIEQSAIPYWFPTNRIPKGDKTGEPLRIGITHVHHFYTKRNLRLIACILSQSLTSPIKKQILFIITSFVMKTGSILHNIGFKEGKINLAGAVPNTLFIPSIIAERNLLLLASGKLSDLKYIFKFPKYILQNIMTISATQNNLLANSIDYIFIDPPFGGNLMYSELNFLWESWLKVFTNNKTEAVENKVQGKGLVEYQHLMTKCFQEYFRVLKPGHWMTVEFHNSKNSVWNAIQEALQIAGFVIADVRTLDKKQGSFNQMTQAGSVKQDIIISAYKPNGGLEERFHLEAGTENGVWDFVQTHLKQLPVWVANKGKMEIVAERQNYLLFDRMVAFHVQRGVMVPLSAAEFYQGLHQRFPERDGMYFLPEQAVEYDKKRMTIKELQQIVLYITNESSAIQWLKQQFSKKPQTFQEVHPQFIREIGGWMKHEKPLELSELLEQNFLRYDGKGDVPSPIHSYLSTNFKELRNLSKDDQVLKLKAKDRWYVPDPNKASDLEKLRERTLLREFNEYKDSKVRRLRVFRLEAVKAGFKKAWQEKDYTTIIAVANKIPESILQEDPKLLMWYDQAITRSEMK